MQAAADTSADPTPPSYAGADLDALGRGPRARRRAQRGHPRPQLPGARGPGRRRPHGRLARALAPRRLDRGRRDRLLRRPLHGRDRLDPLAREDGADPRSRRRLLALGLDQRRPAARLEGRASRARSWSCTSTPRPRSRPRPTTAAPPRTRSRSSSTSGPSTAPRPRSSSAPTCGWARSSPARPGSIDDPERYARFHVWDGECHVHAGIRPDDITRTRAEHPDAEFLIHPECGCSTQALEYVASGDICAEGVHMLSTSGMLDHVEANPDGEFIVATENGMLYPLQQAAPQANLIEANRMAFCKYMKMITLPKVARLAARPEGRGQGPGRDRRAGEDPDRADGCDRIALTSRARGSGATGPRGCAGGGQRRKAGQPRLEPRRDGHLRHRAGAARRPSPGVC